MKTTTEEFLTLSKALAIADALLSDFQKKLEGSETSEALANEWKNAIEKARNLIVTEKL
jgi:hypothetical protein